MKLYIIRNARNNEIYDTAFVDNKLAIEWKYYLKHKSGIDYFVQEVDLPFIGRTVCYVHADYGIRMFSNPMEEDIHRSSIYACIQHAKNDRLWISAINHINNNPQNKYHMTDNMIATDLYGKPFEWGNYCGFNVSIRRIRVNKEQF